MKSFFCVFLCLMFLTSVSAAGGLEILNNGQVINKTVGQNQNFVFTLKNNFSQSFFNISLQSNDYITFSEISQLMSGDSINITATVKKDDFNKNLTFDVYGLFYNDVGIKNETHNINIDWDGQSVCEKSIIEGDKINFTNTGDYEISLLLNYGEISIPAKTSYIVNYNEAGTDFWFRRKVGALQFERCPITVNPSFGYVNDPLKNAKLNVMLKSNYEKTNILTQVLVSNYNIEFNKKDEGAFTITNTGGKILRNLSLSGEWFSFNSNYFDLDPGYTKTIVYTIQPFGITNTSQTNKTYEKHIYLNGNIDSVALKFNVKIPYAVIDGNSSLYSNMTIKDILCFQYPELCIPQVVYRYYDNDSLLVSNVSITDEMWRDYNLELYKLREEMRTVLNSVKESDANQTASTNEIRTDVGKIVQDQEDAKDKSATESTLITSFLLILLLSAIATFSFYFRKYYLLKREKEKAGKW